MKTLFKFNLILFVYVVLFFSQSCFSQTNTDSIFNAAIQKSKQQKYEDAIIDCKTILNIEPNRVDVMNFVANLYGWQHNYTEGKKYIEKAWKVEKTNQDTYSTYLNLLLWSEDYSQLLKACDAAPSYSYKNDLDVFQKRITALRELERFDELNKLIGYDPASRDTSTTKKENVDSVIQVVFKYANKKLYKEGIKIAKTLEQKYPERKDITLLVGNLFAWQNQYDSAKIYVNKILSEDDTNKDGYSSLMNILLWNQEYEDLLYTTDLAEIKGYDDMYNLTMKRTLAKKGLEEYEDAINILESDDAISFADSADIKQLKFDLNWLAKKRAITFFYALDFATKFKPHHFAFAEWANKLEDYTLALRLNYAYRHWGINNTGVDGIQLEADVYKVLKNKREYVYLNYGIGINNYDISVFPKHRLGVEYFFPIDKNIDGSVGGRYFLFSKDKVFILTGHIGTTNNKNWFAFRPYLTFSNSDETLFSFVANYRRYVKHNFDFFGVEFGYGVFPDDRLILQPDGTSTLELNSYKSYRIKLERNFLTKELWEIRLGLGSIFEKIEKDEPTKIVDKSSPYRFLFEILFRYRL